MPKKDPWYSTDPKEKRHHDNTRCGPGSEIPPHNKRNGTGGHPLCDDCARLNREGK